MADAPEVNVKVNYEVNWGPGGPPEKVNVFRKAYRQLNDNEKTYLEALKDKAQELYDLIENGNPCQSCPEPYEKTQAKLKLEESIMWAVKDVTR